MSFWPVQSVCLIPNDTQPKKKGMLGHTHMLCVHTPTCGSECDGTHLSTHTHLHTHRVASPGFIRNADSVTGAGQGAE